MACLRHLWSSVYYSNSFADYLSYRADYIISATAIEHLFCFSYFPYRSWRDKLQNNSILLFVILLFFSCVEEIQCLTHNTTHTLIMSLCILDKPLLLLRSHPYSYVFFFTIFWCFSCQTYHFPSTSIVYYWLLQNVNLFLLFIYIFSWTNLELILSYLWLILDWFTSHSCRSLSTISQ